MYSAKKVADMFQNETVDEILRPTGESILDVMVARIDSLNDEPHDESGITDLVTEITGTCELVDAVDSENNNERISMEPTENIGYYRKKRLNKANWKQNRNKKQRNLGEAYEGKKLDATSGQWLNIPRPARKMGPLCTKESCRQKKNFNCERFD